MSRIQTPDHLAAEDDLERSLRPQGLDDFVGQDAVKDQLAVSLQAAKARGEARDGLLDLGFPLQEAELLLDAAGGETVEELIQSALRLARR